MAHKNRTLSPLWWLILVASLTRFHITVETHLWVHLLVFLEKFNWGRKWGSIPWARGTEWIKRRKWAEYQYSFLTDDTMWQLPRVPAAAIYTFLIVMDCTPLSTVTQNKPSPFKVAIVKYFVIATKSNKYSLWVCISALEVNGPITNTHMTSLRLENPEAKASVTFSPTNNIHCVLASISL